MADFMDNFAEFVCQCCTKQKLRMRVNMNLRILCPTSHVARHFEVGGYVPVVNPTT